MIVVAEFADIASVRRRKCTACLLSSIRLEDKYTEPSDSGPARHTNFASASRTQMPRSTLVLSARSSSAAGSVHRRSSGSGRNKKKRRDVGAGPLWGPARCLGLPFWGSWSRHERWAARYAAAGLRSESSSKIPVYAQATSSANASARRRENWWGEATKRSPSSTTHRRACTYTRPGRSRRADTRDTRFVLFPSSHSRRQIFLEFVSGHLSQKGPRPTRVLFNLAYTPLRSAARRSILLLQLRGKAVTGRAVSQSIDEESRRTRLTIAARSTVRDDVRVGLPPKSGYRVAKPNGSSNRTSLSGAKSYAKRNAATCRVKAESYHRHQDTYLPYRRLQVLVWWAESR